MCLLTRSCMQELLAARGVKGKASKTLLFNVHISQPETEAVQISSHCITGVENVRVHPGHVYHGHPVRPKEKRLHSASYQGTCTCFPSLQFILFATCALVNCNGYQGADSKRAASSEMHWEVTPTDHSVSDDLHMDTHNQAIPVLTILNSTMRRSARVQIPVCPEPPLVFSHELLGRLRTGFLVVSPCRIACVFLHWV
jgi:hypothetical protein